MISQKVVNSSHRRNMTILHHHLRLNLEVHSDRKVAEVRMTTIEIVTGIEAMVAKVATNDE